MLLYFKGFSKMRVRKAWFIMYVEPTQQELSTAIRWAYILHDKDIQLDNENNPICDENGQVQFKKSHYHVWVEYSHARSFSAIAKTFEINENAVLKVHNNKSSLGYLTHRTEKAIAEGKHLYEPSEVVKSNDLEFDFSEVQSAGGTTDYYKIFNNSTLKGALDDYYKAGEVIDSLAKYSQFVSTFRNTQDLFRKGNM